MGDLTQDLMEIACSTITFGDTKVPIWYIAGALYLVRYSIK